MSIKTKLILWTLPLAGGSFLLLTLFLNIVVRSVLEDQLRDRGYSVAQNFILEPRLLKAIKNRAESELLPFLQTFKGHVGAGNVFVTDPKGAIIVHTNVAEVGKPYSDGLHPSGQLTAARLKRGGEAWMEFAVPIWDRPKGRTDPEEFLFSGETTKVHLGTLYFELSLEKIKGTSLKISKEVGLIIVFLTFVSLGVSLYMLRKILAPIEKLEQAADRIASGEPGGTIDINSEDEIGRLAQRFNRMSRRLSDTMVSIDFLRRFEFTVNTSKDFISLIGKNYVYVLANAALAKAHGKKPEDIIGKTVAQVWGEQDFEERIKNSLERCFTGEEVHYATWINLPVSGRRYIEATFNPYRNSEGTVTHAVVVSRDLTDERNLQEQVTQSEKLALIGQLASGVAHEINNPLAGILATTQVALSELPPSAAQLNEDLKAIESSAQRCKKIVANLLGFSRSNPLSIGPVNLGDNLKQVLSLLGHESELARVHLINELPQNLPLVQASSLELQQVLSNIILNAIQGSAEGGKIHLSAQGSPNGAVLLRVRDNGAGIEPAVMKKIFAPFFTTKPPGKGTGLGLSICLRLVRQFGGDLVLESQGKGKGTTAVLTLKTAHSARGAEGV